MDRIERVLSVVPWWIPYLAAVMAMAVLLCAPAKAAHLQGANVQCANCQNCNGQCANCSCVPVVVDTHGAWPWQGPFRWTGAVGRWVTGAQPRYQQRIVPQQSPPPYRTR